MKMAAKQVLVMKKFPKDRNMRTGKYVAQGAHAAVGAIFSLGSVIDDKLVIPLSDPFVKEWITGRFAKIALYVETDQELVDLYKKAQDAGLPTALIKDAGLTEFAGVPTLTAVGIGPGSVEVINKITAHLPLF
jgi:PTH2 family peptidyl-tRNA hydrolase